MRHDIRDAFRTVIRSPGYSSSPLPCWRSASVRRARSSASSTACCCGHCPTPNPTGSSGCGRSRHRSQQFDLDGELSRLATQQRRFRGDGGNRRQRRHDVRRHGAGADPGRVCRRATSSVSARAPRSGARSRRTKINRARTRSRSSPTGFGSGSLRRPRRVGKTVNFNGEPHTIIGVMPAASAFERGRTDSGGRSPSVQPK